MCEELSYQIINTSAVNKNHYRKKTVLTVASKAEMHFFIF